MSVLSTVGIAAMLWVGGHILLVGLDELGVSVLYDFVHHLEEDVDDALGAVGGVAAWLTNTAASAVLGLVVGADRRGGHAPALRSCHCSRAVAGRTQERPAEWRAVPVLPDYVGCALTQRPAPAASPRA